MLWDLSSWCRCPVPGVSVLESTSPLSAPTMSLPTKDSLVPSHISALPPLFDVALSLHLAVESLFCQSLGHFLVLSMWVLSRCIHGTRWALGLPTLPSFPHITQILNKEVKRIHRNQGEISQVIKLGIQDMFNQLSKEYRAPNSICIIGLCETYLPSWLPSLDPKCSYVMDWFRCIFAVSQLPVTSIFKRLTSFHPTRNCSPKVRHGLKWKVKGWME